MSQSPTTNTSISIAYSGRGSAVTVASNISFRGKVTRANLICGCRISSVSEKMSRFTVTLPSNRSMNYYEDNTVAQFTTKLAQRTELDGDWEVGLSSIGVPAEVENVIAKECYCNIYYDDVLKWTVTLPPGLLLLLLLLLYAVTHAPFHAPVLRPTSWPNARDRRDGEVN